MCEIGLFSPRKGMAPEASFDRICCQVGVILHRFWTRLACKIHHVFLSSNLTNFLGDCPVLGSNLGLDVIQELAVSSCVMDSSNRRQSLDLFLRLRLRCLPGNPQPALGITPFFAPRLPLRLDPTNQLLPPPTLDSFSMHNTPA